jgi:hypothetical protein
MFRERPLEASVRRRRVDEDVEKDHAVTLGQHNGLVLRDRAARGFRQSGHAEIGQFPPLKLRGAFDQSLRRLVDAKAQPLFSQTSVAHSILSTHRRCPAAHSKFVKLTVPCAPHSGQKVGCRLSTVTVHARSRRSTSTTFKPALGDHGIDVFIAPCCRIPSQGASRPASPGASHPASPAPRVNQTPLRWLPTSASESPRAIEVEAFRDPGGDQVQLKKS